MDNTQFLVRGWWEESSKDSAVVSGKGQGFSRVTGKHLLACRKRGREMDSNLADMSDAEIGRLGAEVKSRQRGPHHSFPTPAGGPVGFSL